METHHDESRWERSMVDGLRALEESNLTQAEACFSAAIETAEALGPDEPRLVSSLKNLAGVLGSEQRYDDAEPILERVLELSLRTLGPDHPDVVVCLRHLAWLAERHGERLRARDFYRSSLETEDKAFGSETDRSLPTLFSLARLYHTGEPVDPDTLQGEVYTRLEDIAESCRTHGREERAQRVEAYVRQLRATAH